MPDMNGFELYKKMKNIDGRIEACFITAFEDYREEFKESFPMLDEAKHFRKPKAIEDLVNQVATILGGRRVISFLCFKFSVNSFTPSVIT
jgi:two-component SAPR family response regulator